MRKGGGGIIIWGTAGRIFIRWRRFWRMFLKKVSIWHPGHHNNPFGMRLSALMISKRIPDSSVPMSLLADHPQINFHYLRPGIGEVSVEMH